ncbi:MAG TPA: TonB-dependent receptor [Allosphingosinicella sp.]|jgi:outer membrane receptor protein involved in Fe transport
MRTTFFRIHGSLAALAAALAAPSPASAQEQAPPRAPSKPPSPTQSPPRPAGEASRDVVVTGTRAEVVGSPDRTSFNVSNDLQVQNGTLADALRAVPGVEVDLQGNVSLRGDPGVTILIDGRPSAMLRGDNRGEVILSMPAGRIERVEVMTNPSAANSPEGSGGVINLVSRQARKAMTTGTVRATVGGEGRGALSLSGSHNAGDLTVTGEVAYRRFSGEAEAVQLRSRLDSATGAFVDSRLDSELDNSNAFASARIGIDYDVDKKNRLSTELSYRDGRADIDRDDRFAASNPAFSYDRDSDIDLSQRGLSARASWRRTLPGKDHEFAADLELERGRFRREVDAVTDFAAAPDFVERIANEGRRADDSAKLDYKRRLGDESTLNLGYQGNFSRSDFDFSGDRGPGFEPLLPVAGLTNRFEYDQAIHAVFGTMLFPVGKLDAQAGLRLEQVETDLDQVTDGARFENDYFRVYPTLHLGYDLNKREQLKASYSRRIQRPSPQDLNPYTFYVDPQNLRRGNPALKPEVTDSVELGWQRRKSGDFLSLTGFYRRSRGGVTDILSDLGGGVFLTSRANLATAERAGLEAVANGKLSKTLSYNASATFLWNEIDSRTGGVSSRRSGTTGTARVNLSWQPGKKDFFQLNAAYSGRQLLPQGYRSSGPILNLGYRRKLSDRFSVLVTGQDVLSSAKQTIVFETPTLRDRLEQRGIGRVILFGLAWNIGDRNPKKKEPQFEFQQGGGETVQ